MEQDEQSKLTIFGLNLHQNAERKRTKSSQNP